MKRKNIYFVLAAALLGLFIGSYVINEAEALEETQVYNSAAFLAEIHRHSLLLKEWKSDSLDMGLYPKQKEVFNHAIVNIRQVQSLIRQNRPLNEIMTKQNKVNTSIQDVFSISDFRYINWKNSFHSFEDQILALLSSFKKNKEDYIAKLHAINNIRRRYIEFLLPKGT